MFNPQSSSMNENFKKTYFGTTFLDFFDIPNQFGVAQLP